MYFSFYKFGWFWGEKKIGEKKKKKKNHLSQGKMGIQTQEADLKLLQLNEVVGVSFISGETALCSGITAK